MLVTIENIKNLQITTRSFTVMQVIQLQREGWWGRRLASYGTGTRPTWDTDAFKQTI
jgi:hypothetical protein